MAPNFCPSSRRINGSILKYVAIDATKKTDEKTSHVVNFIVSMTLIERLNVNPCLGAKLHRCKGFKTG